MQDKSQKHLSIQNIGPAPFLVQVSYRRAIEGEEKTKQNKKKNVEALEVN